MPGLLRRVAGAAIEGYGKGIVAEAMARREATLAMLRENRADARTAAQIASRERIAGSLTPAQRRDNAETETARRQMVSLGLTPEEFLRRATRPSDLGLLSGEAEYNPNLLPLLRTAKRRKHGDDPDYRGWVAYFAGTGPLPGTPPKANGSAGATPGTPGAGAPTGGATSWSTTWSPRARR